MSSRKKLNFKNKYIKYAKIMNAYINGTMRAKNNPSLENRGKQEKNKTAAMNALLPAEADTPCWEGFTPPMATDPLFFSLKTNGMY